MMFPTLDNVQEYLNAKQWDKLLKEYSKYKVIIQQTKESNVVLEMVGDFIMIYEWIDSRPDEWINPKSYWFNSFFTL